MFIVPLILHSSLRTFQLISQYFQTHLFALLTKKVPTTFDCERDFTLPFI